MCSRSLPQPYIYRYELQDIASKAPTYYVLRNKIERFFLDHEPSKRFFNDELLGFVDYDGFEKDIALVEIYYPSSKIISMKTQSRMSWIDYLSTVGGLLGLVLGMGFMSFIEIFWLCLRMAALKLNFQNVVP